MLFKLKALVFHVIARVYMLAARLVALPRPILFVGPNSAVQLCNAIVATGCTRCLLVTDSILVELGLHQVVVDTLSKQGVVTFIYSGITPDPTMIQVQEGLSVQRDNQCDAIIGLGGGSSMDAAKVIAAAATNDKPIEKLVGVFKVTVPPLPLFALPTTSGTGSEATVAAIISNPNTGEKQQILDGKLVPKMVALDCLLMQGMPKPVTAATGMDALTHAIEAYVSANAIDETDTLAVAAVRLIFKHLPSCYHDGQNLEAREAMALASFYAGSAFTRTSVGYVHALAHTFGTKYHTPHGVANAIALPWVLDFYAQKSHTRLAQLARVAGVGHSSDTEEVLALAFIAAIRDLQKELGIAVHLEALKPNDIPAIAKTALSEAHGLYAVPNYMKQSDCEAMLSQMLES